MLFVPQNQGKLSAGLAGALRCVMIVEKTWQAELQRQSTLAHVVEEGTDLSLSLYSSTHEATFLVSKDTRRFSYPEEASTSIQKVFFYGLIVL